MNIYTYVCIQVPTLFNASVEVQQEAADVTFLFVGAYVHLCVAVCIAVHGVVCAAVCVVVCVAVCVAASVAEFVAVCCSVLHSVAGSCRCDLLICRRIRMFVCCSMLQYVLQCVLQ